MTANLELPSRGRTEGGGVKLPLHVGDTKNVVVVIHCDAEALDFLCNELPQNDRFTRELHEAARFVAAYERRPSHDRD